MLVRDGDVFSPSNYVAIPASLRGVGRHIQVYVDGDDLASVEAELVGDIIHTFDDRIFPLMSSRFGPALDVDGDGRFTVLLSSWLLHLGGGRYAVDGFVRVADLDLAYRSPLGNRCDMMYLSTALESGPHLRTVMAHEYMHAVLVGQKGRRDGQAPEPPRKRKVGSTRPSLIWRRIAAAFPRRILTIASARSWRGPSDTSLSWTTILRPTCSGAMGIAEAPIYS